MDTWMGGLPTTTFSLTTVLVAAANSTMPLVLPMAVLASMDVVVSGHDADAVIVGRVGEAVAAGLVPPDSMVPSSVDGDAAAPRAGRAHAISHRDVALDANARGPQQEDTGTAVGGRDHILDAASGAVDEGDPARSKTLDDAGAANADATLAIRADPKLVGDLGPAASRGGIGQARDREPVEIQLDPRRSKCDTRRPLDAARHVTDQPSVFGKDHASGDDPANVLGSGRARGERRGRGDEVPPRGPAAGASRPIPLLTA